MSALSQFLNKHFAFRGGYGELTPFWTDNGEQFAHHLSQAQTGTFCDLAGVSLLQ